MLRYGKFPHYMGCVNVECKEMMFYQYLPIKLAGTASMSIEPRLLVFSDMIGQCCCDFIGEYGLDRYVNSYVYLTVKHMYQLPGCPYNREGWHSDGFMTDDINYVWSNNNGFTFNDGEFNLSQDHDKSLVEMIEQEDYRCNGRVGDNELYRLDQFVIHKVSEVIEPCLRTFFKLSISSDKYNLIGNSHNYKLDYDWEMKSRDIERNHPSK